MAAVTTREALWAVLMLQSWLDTTVGQSASRAADVLEPAQ